MKLFLLLPTLIILACQTPPIESVTTEPKNEFDAALAKEIGADKYGMSQYVLAYLKRGPNRDRSPEEAKALQAAHLENISRMAEEGKLVIAGPFMDDTDIRGIYIFAVETIEEAAALTETDPAIQAGSLEMELHPWYGPAALKLLKDIHPRVTEQEF